MKELQVKPSIGIGGVYLFGFLFMAFNLSNKYFGGIAAGICVLTLLVLFFYFRWPKLICIKDEGVIFEFYSGKLVQLSFNTIHKITNSGLFKWRVIFKNGGWSDILNYSLISKDNKLTVYNRFLKYNEIENCPNK